MNTSAIFNFIREIEKCQYTPNFTGLLEDFTYNGITYVQGSVTYHNLLNKLLFEFKKQVIELNSTSKNKELQAIYTDCIKARDVFYDIPTDEAINSLNSELSNGNQNVRKELQEVVFLREMCGIQKTAIHNAIDFISTFIHSEIKEDTFVEEIQAKPTKEKEMEKIPENRIISGVREIAKYMKICTTTLNKINQSGTMYEKGITYKIGRQIFFDCNKYDSLSSAEKNQIHNIHKKRK